MRIRQVKPEFWADVKLRDLNDTERLVFIGLWMQADDSGYLRWDPARIAVELFPWDSPAKRERKVAKAWDRLRELGRLLPFDGCAHVVIPKLTDHQRFAGTTKQVHTFRREHESCRQPAGARGDPRAEDDQSTEPTHTRGDPRFPARLGQVRLGQVRSGQVDSSDGPPTNESLTPAVIAQLRHLSRSTDVAMAKHAQDRLRKAGVPVEEAS